MKTLLEYIQKKHITPGSDYPKLYVFSSKLSDEANFDATMYITNEFYDEFSPKEIHKVLSIIDNRRCSLSQADYTMSTSLHDAFDTWISDKEIEWEDDDTKTADLKALQELKDDYFDDDDFFMNMPDKKEFEKLKTQYNYDYN